MNKKKIISASLITTAVAGGVFCHCENNLITTDKFLYQNKKIPDEFNNLKIVHISDLHNKSFKKNNKMLLNTIEKLSPDIIVISGDLIDKRRTDLSDIKIAEGFIINLLTICDVYFVSGNHEVSSPVRSDFFNFLKKTNVHICNNTSFALKRGNSTINISGVADPISLGYYKKEEYIGQFTDILHTVRQKSTSDFNILLSHRPELLEYYEKEKFDLVFSGHAHGGQARVPFLGGLYAPSQGIMPKYTSGLYQLNRTTLVVSRGLGNSGIPQRVFNHPNLIMLTLSNKL